MEPPPVAGDSHTPPTALHAIPWVSPLPTGERDAHTHARIATALSHVTACTPRRYPGSCAPHHTHPHVSLSPSLSLSLSLSLSRSLTLFRSPSRSLSLSLSLSLSFPATRSHSPRGWGVLICGVRRSRMVPGVGEARPPIPAAGAGLGWRGGGMGRRGGGGGGRAEDGGKRRVWRARVGGGGCVCGVGRIRFIKSYTAIGRPASSSCTPKYTPPLAPTGRRMASLTGPRLMGVNR